MPDPIRLALVGAGNFARDAHVPAINALGDRFEIAAVYSRTRATAEALLPSLSGQPEIYTDLSALLKRAEIEAVDLLLPIGALPTAIDMAFAAGKHVISEKPISPDVMSGRRLIAIHRNHPGQVWMVAENYRYEPSFRRAGELVRGGSIGRVMVAQWSLYLPTRPGNKYYGTDWRRNNSFPGGFLLDGGVHHVAGLRQVLGEIASVSAEVKQMMDDLPPADTLSAAISFASGVIGNYTVTYTAGAPFPTYLTVIGETGVVRATSHSVILNDGQPEDFSARKSVNDELAAFADAIRSGQPQVNTALEALKDVAVVEAMLKSGESGCRVEVESLDDLT